LPDPEQLDIARTAGPGFAKKIKTRVFKTVQEARDFAKSLGLEITTDETDAKAQPSDDSPAGRTSNSMADKIADRLGSAKRANASKVGNEAAIQFLTEYLDSIEEFTQKLGTDKLKQAHADARAWVKKATTPVEKPTTPVAAPAPSPETKPVSAAAAAAQKARERIAPRVNAAKERLRAKAAGRTMQTGIDPQDLADFAVIGADYVLQGYIRFATWSARVREELADILGDLDEATLRDIHDAAAEIAERELQAVQGGEEESTIEEESTTDEPSSIEPEESGTRSDGLEDSAPLGGTLPEGSSSTTEERPARGRGGRRGRTNRASDGRSSGQQPDVGAGSRTGNGGVEVSSELSEPGDAAPPNVGGSNRLERDYRIPDGRVISGTPEKRAKDNIAALELLIELEKSGRTATPAEQAVLAKYVGWGAVPQLFAGQTDEWRDLQEKLRSLISDEEYSDARRSTTNAHYTSDTVVDAIWRAVQRLGAKPGMTWIEPAVGVGNFFGRQPAELLEGARRVGLDKDSLVTRFAKFLYPDSSIENSAYEKAEMPLDYFDGAISNVPFGDFGVHDPAFKPSEKFLTGSIHNYFFAKTLTHVRPGGIVAFVTSRYTLDGYSKAHQQVREWIEDRADFLGAVRLPNTAFRQNAGTDVVTDVIFLRRRLPGEPSKSRPWLKSEQKTVKRKVQALGFANQAEISVNEWFNAHPEAIIGSETLTRGQFSANDYVVEGSATTEALNSALDKSLPEGAFQEWSGKENAQKQVRIAELGADIEAKLGALFFGPDGKLYRRTSRGSALPENVKPSVLPRIKGQLQIRDVLRDQLRLEREDATEKDIEENRKALNDIYDKFVKEYGRLQSPVNQNAVSGDPDAPVLYGLERDWDKDTKKWKKAPIFTKRVRWADKTVVTAANGQEALTISLNETGRIDFDRMRALTGKTDEQLQQELVGIIYQDPTTKTWLTADEYLSGAVRKKLREARAIAKIDPKFEANVKALEVSQPDDIPPSGISANLGVTWVPIDAYQEFVQHILGSDGLPDVIYSGGEWFIELKNAGRTSSMKWDTKKVKAIELLKDGFNLRRPVVYSYDSTLKRDVIDRDETLAAQNKLAEIQNAFQEWLFGTTERAQKMGRLYNDLVNDLRLRKFDGSHLTLPGMTRNPDVVRGGDLEPHQKAAIWRQIVQKNVLLAHAVGAGKTYEMIAAGMELKRLGVIKRPMYVVPNATLTGWQEQFTALYPEARVLVFGEKDLERKKRRRTVGLIATGEWDAVVIPHSSFQLIKVGDETFERHFGELAAELEQQIADSTEAGMDSRFIKRLEKQKERLLESLEERRAENKQDNTVSWEELGIDQLFVDESHEYKKLGFATKQAGIAGIDNGSNQKTFDLIMKVRHTQARGRGVVFATGTPVTNTMGELFSIMRYLIEPDMKARMMGRFDEWSAAFGRTVPVFEKKPEGGGYRMKNRFSKFVNLPELATLFRTFSDVVTSDMLNIPRPTAKRESIVTNMTDSQMEYMEGLQARGGAIRANPRKAFPDNMLAVFTDATKASLDIRMVDPNGTDDPDSRLNAAADKIFKIWQDTKENKSTQLVMADMGKPAETKRKGRSKKSKNPPITPDTGFSVYDELIKKLVEKGIPREEIAHIYQAKNKDQRTSLFRKVRDGDVRIMIGSTAKMGVGVNVQDKLIAMHHLDTPHRPSDLEQREGRIIRQGNQNSEVMIFNYVTKGSLDELKLGGVLRKAKFIRQVMKGDVTVREAEDVDESSLVPSLEMLTAVASGDPRIMRKLEVDSEVDRLSAIERAWRDKRYTQRWELEAIPRAIDFQRKIIGRTTKLIEARDRAEGKVWEINNRLFEGEGYRNKIAETGVFNTAALEENVGGVLGTVFGIRLHVGRYGTKGSLYIELGKSGIEISLADTPQGTIASIESVIAKLDHRIENAERIIAENEKKQAELESELAEDKWKYADKLNDLLKEQRELTAALASDKPDDSAAVAGEDEEIEADTDADEEPDTDEDEDASEENGEENDENGEVVSKSRAVHPAARVAPAITKREPVTVSVWDKVDESDLLPLSDLPTPQLRSKDVFSGNQAAPGNWVTDGKVAFDATAFVLEGKARERFTKKEIGGPGGIAQDAIEKILTRSEDGAKEVKPLGWAKVGTKGDEEPVLMFEDGTGAFARQFSAAQKMFGAELTVKHKPGDGNAFVLYRDGKRVGLIMPLHSRNTPKLGKQSERGGMAPDLFMPWRWGKKDVADPQTKVTFLDESIEKRFQDAGQPNEESVRSKLKEFWKQVKGLKEVFPLLPRKQYGRLIFELVQFQKQAGIARSKAAENIVRSIKDLSPNQYDLFRKKVVMDDLLATVEEWEKEGGITDEGAQVFELAFGFTPETLKANHAHITAAVEQSDAVKNAVSVRDRTWTELREDLIEAMRAAGEDIDDRLTRRHYYRHRVLAHLQDQMRSGGGRLQTPAGRSYMKRRSLEAAALDYSTDYITSEYAVMSQVLNDTSKAQMIGWIKDEENGLNILPKLKAQAKQSNIAAVMPYFEAMADEMNKSADLKQPVTGADMFRRILNRPQAMAVTLFGKLAARGELPNEGDRWTELIEELADGYLAKKAEEADTEEPASMSVDMPALIKYAAWLSKAMPEGDAAGMPARQLLKGIHDKQAAIEQIAGDKYIDPSNEEELLKKLGPEGYTAWYPREGNIFYTGYTIPEEIAKQLLERVGDEIGISAEQIRRASIMGGKRAPIIIPTEVAETLEGLTPQKRNALDVGSAAVLSKWKEYQLISPPRVIKYNLRNLSGDAEATFTGNPKAFGKLKQSIQELRAYYRGGEMSPGLRAWFERGGFQSTLQVQEMGDLNNIEVLDKLLKTHQTRTGHPAQRIVNPANLWRAWFNKARLASDFREALLRYANFLAYSEQLQGSDKPANYGASIPAEVDALEDRYDKAYKLSNDLLGAYDEISAAGQHIRRHWIPFWSFQELNFRRYKQMLKNAARDKKLANAVGRRMLGAAAARSPYLAYRVGSFGIMALGFWAFLEAWNRFWFPDEEKALREEVRKRPHIILGRHSDGSVRYFSRLGNLPDILEWFDPEDSAAQIKDWANGRATALQAAKNIATFGPIEKLWLSVNPGVKLPAELALGRSAYPSLERPRTIYDRAEYLADHFGLGDAYRKSMGRPQPQRSYFRAGLNLATYEADPKQSAYYDTLDTKADYMRQREKGGSSSGSATLKSEALRNMKLALRYGDKEAFAKYIAEYAAEGGTRKGLQQSIKNLHPLAGLSKAERADFMNSLGAEDKRRLTLAIEYYEEVFVGDRLSEYVRDAAPTIQKRLAAGHPAGRAGRR
jgi:N12 class adenine-specific DNA methylase